MISATIQDIIDIVGGEITINNGALNNQINGVSIDSRKISLNNIYFAIQGARVDGHTYLDDVSKYGASLAIIDNEKYCNAELPTLLVEDTVETLQRLAKAYRSRIKAKVFAITGSNGKTSCKDLLASVLESKYAVIKTLGNQNNEIGVPLTLLRASKETDFIVLEMGMENLGDIHFLNAIAKPDLGIVTNVGIAHLENLKTIKNIGRAKLELMDGLQKNALFIYNGDDPILGNVIHEKDTKELQIKTFGIMDKNTIYLTDFKQNEEVIEFESNMSPTVFTIKTLGKHQALNALPVLLCAYQLGLDDSMIQKGLNNYISTGMRNEILHIENMTVLNDAYKSNPQSAKAALDTFEGMHAAYKIIVLGDMLDLGPNQNAFHYDVGEYLKNITYDELIGFGEQSKYIIDGAKSVKSDRKYMHATTHDEIYAHLNKYKTKDCAVLFKGSRGMKLDEIVDRLIGE